MVIPITCSVPFLVPFCMLLPYQMRGVLGYSHMCYASRCHTVTMLQLLLFLCSLFHSLPITNWSTNYLVSKLLTNSFVEFRVIVDFQIHRHFRLCAPFSLPQLHFLHILSSLIFIIVSSLFYILKFEIFTLGDLFLLTTTTFVSNKYFHPSHDSLR